MGAPSFSELQSAGAKFGLSDAELQQGLNAFASWHQNRFGGGFTNTSSAGAIVNGAVQNALNARANPAFYSQPWTSWEGGGPQGTALNYAATPERIAAHRADEIYGLLQAEKAAAAQANPWDIAAGGTRGIGGSNGNIFTAFGNNQWTEAEMRSLSSMFAANGKNGADLKTAIAGLNSGDMTWWGPQAYIQALGTAIGADPAPYMDQTAFNREQKASADAGNAAQAKMGGLGESIPIVLAVGGLALGFAAASGAFAAGAAAGEAGAAAGGWVSAEGGAGYLGGLAADSAALGAAAGAGAVTPLVDAGTGAIAGDAGTAAATGLATPTANTGGILVGNNGLLGSTGNALADAALNSGGQSIIKSTIMGGDDPLKSGVIGAITGGFGSVISEYIDTGSSVVDSAVRGGIGGGVGTALAGGDVLNGIITGAGAGVAGNIVGGEVANATDSSTLGTLAGTVASTVAGGVINSALTDTTGSAAATNVTNATNTADAGPASNAGVKFNVIEPALGPTSRTTNWDGTRLSTRGVPQ